MNNQQNLTNLGVKINHQLPPPVNAHNLVVAKNLNNDALGMKPPIPHLQEFYRGNINITDSDRSLVLPPPP